MENPSISTGLRYTAHAIRSLALYPDELRARARKAAISGRFRPSLRQLRNGTGRKRAAHCGTTESQSLTQNDPMGDGNLRTGSDHEPVMEVRMADALPKPILPYLEGKHGELRIMRFWSHVDIGSPEDCWEWQASLHTSGYGRFKIASYVTMMANRVSLVIHTQEEPFGKMALHHCDNPKCCNPHHLYWGTASDNMRDRAERGRANPADQAGVNNGAVKLTEEQLAEIIAKFRQGLNNKQIASALPVSHSLVSRIRTGRSWVEQSAALGWQPQPQFKHKQA